MTSTPPPARSLADNPRIRLYPRALMGAVLLAFLLFVISSSGSDAATGRVGGDYPAFYAAGQLVVDDPASLYDLDAQTAAQADLLHGEPEGSVIYFSYPVHVALAYAPLAALPYTASYVVHTALMAGLLVLALQRLRPLVPLLDRWFEQAAIVSVLFFPMFRGITGGQTTALLLCLLCVGVRAMADRHDVVAGLCFALALVKPQYALPFLGVALLLGRWRVAATGALGALVVYGVGAAVQGWGWLGPWFDQVRWFSENAADSDAVNAVSWLGVAEGALGAGDPVATGVGWTLAAATAAAMAGLWWRNGGRDPALLLAFSLPAVLLLAPHALYYDVGVLVVSFLILADRRRGLRKWIVVLWLLGWVHVSADALGVSPLIGVVVATMALAGRELWRGRNAPRGRQAPPASVPGPSPDVQLTDL